MSWVTLSELSTRDSRESAPETKQDLSDSWQLAKAFPPCCVLTQQARLTSLSVQTMVRGEGRSDNLLHATAGSSGTGDNASLASLSLCYDCLCTNCHQLPRKEFWHFYSQ